MVMFERPEDAMRAARGEALVMHAAEMPLLNLLASWSGPASGHPIGWMPKKYRPEYGAIEAVSRTPWGQLLVETYARDLLIEGYLNEDGKQSPLWAAAWQRNRMDRRQVALMMDVLRYGRAVTLSLPGVHPLTGESMPVVSTFSPRSAIAVYSEASAEYPEYALMVDREGSKFRYRVVDDDAVYTWLSGEAITQLSERALADPVLSAPGGYDLVSKVRHGLGVCPVVEFSIQYDADGRVAGLVEPIVSVLARLNQTVQNRMMVEQYGAHQVRTATGMAPPEEDATDGMTDTEIEAYRAARKVAMSVDDMLVGGEGVTFGTLSGSPLQPFLDAERADIQALSGVGKIPPHYLLGQISNLSAEALVAAEQSKNGQLAMLRLQLADCLESLFRLWGHISGDAMEAAATSSQVRWRNDGSRSMAQTIDALVKLASIDVPLEMLLEMIPGWSDQDVARAVDLIASPDSLQAALDELAASSTQPTRSTPEVTVDAIDPVEE